MSTSADDPLVPRPADGRVFARAAESASLTHPLAGGCASMHALDTCKTWPTTTCACGDAEPDGVGGATNDHPRRADFPQYLDWLTLATWCSGLGPRWAERRYSMTGERGVVEAATLWVHVDMTTMKPVALPAGFEEQFGRRGPRAGG